MDHIGNDVHKRGSQISPRRRGHRAAHRAPVDEHLDIIVDGHGDRYRRGDCRQPEFLANKKIRKQGPRGLHRRVEGNHLQGRMLLGRLPSGAWRTSWSGQTRRPLAWWAAAGTMLGLGMLSGYPPGTIRTSTTICSRPGNAAPPRSVKRKEPVSYGPIVQVPKGLNARSRHACLLSTPTSMDCLAVPGVVLRRTLPEEVRQPPRR